MKLIKGVGNRDSYIFLVESNLYNSLEDNLAIFIKIKDAHLLWPHNSSSVNSSGNSCSYTGPCAQINILGQEY